MFTWLNAVHSGVVYVIVPRMEFVTAALSQESPLWDSEPDYCAHKISFICLSDLIHFALLAYCRFIKKEARVSVVKFKSATEVSLSLKILACAAPLTVCISIWSIHSQHTLPAVDHHCNDWYGNETMNNLLSSSLICI